MMESLTVQPCREDAVPELEFQGALLCPNPRNLSETELSTLLADMVKLARAAARALEGNSESGAQSLRGTLNECASLLETPIPHVRVWDLVKDVGKAYDEHFVVGNEAFVRHHADLVCQLYNFLATASNFLGGVTYFRSDLTTVEVVLCTQ